MHSIDPASRALYICSDASNDRPTRDGEHMAQGRLCHLHRNAVPRAQLPKAVGVQEKTPYFCHQEMGHSELWARLYILKPNEDRSLECTKK